MAVHKLYWCNNCRRFEAVTGPDAELVNRPTGWLRVELQSSDVGLKLLHFCPECGERYRESLFAFFVEPGPRS